MQALTASWGAWMSAYEKHCASLPAPADTSCPSCGATGLRLAFSGSAEVRVGYASFWCDACLVGVHLSRCAVPDGVPMDSVHTPVEERAVRIPDYTLVWPDDHG